MANTVTIKSIEELYQYRETIFSNLAHSTWKIKSIIESENAHEVFKLFKFGKIAIEPLSGKPENLIEVVNQSQTYLVTLAAVEYLFPLFPDKAYILNWGNIGGYDIETNDGEIIAECFAATSYRSNGKLTADLKRLSSNKTALHKYEFFYAADFTESSKKYYERKYDGINIVRLESI